MKRYPIAALLIALLLWGSRASSVASPSQQMNSIPGFRPEQSISRSEYRPGQILLKFRAEVPEAQATDTLRAHDLVVLGEVGDLEVLRLAVPEGHEEALVEKLAQDPRVEYAEFDYVVRATIVPNDALYSQQWGPAKIQAASAWDIMGDTSALSIAILDTGVDLYHPDLDAKVLPGWDFVNNDNIAQDDHGHGTHAAGVAAAETNNYIGVAGIGWGAHVMPVKVLDSAGEGYYSDVAAGINWACGQGAQIIGMSFGGSSPSSTLEQAVQNAYSDGCLMVAAAGNGYGDGVDYPAAYPETMAVAATNQSDLRASFSDYGPEVDVAAPGVGIYSTLWYHTYSYGSGTSTAAPHVAGQAALVWSVCSSLTNGEVQDVIETTAHDLGAAGKDNYYGFGRINAHDAVQAATRTLTVNRTLMIFLADATTGPRPQTLLVGNDSLCDSLNWSAVESASWLDISPVGGEASLSEPGEITVTVDKGGLGFGTYETTITVSSATPGVQGSPQTVDVRFVYSATPLERCAFPLAARN
jgi:thermitase